jgi:hypothetical protein
VNRFRPALVLVTFVAVASATFLVSRSATPPASASKTLTVSLTEPVIEVGRKSRASASEVLPDGRREQVASPTWTSNAVHVAAIDAGGQVTGRAPGTAQVTASAPGAEGSNSVVVSGPEWQLVLASSMTPPPDGSRLAYKGQDGAERQGAAVVHGRATWMQTSEAATLLVPIALPAGVDRFALQVDFWAPTDARGRQSLEFAPLEAPGQLGTSTLTLAGAQGWRTIRVEGSREACDMRYFVDGTEVPARKNFCQPGSDILRLGAVSVEDGTADVAWSNLRVFQGTPVASIPVTIQLLPSGG